MSLTPIFKLIEEHQLVSAIRVNSLYKPFYKLSFLVGLKNSGLLECLSKKPLTFDELANTYCTNSKEKEALSAWLQLGIRLKLLGLKEAKYILKGIAFKMSLPENDSTLALAQEVATLHHKLIIETPTKLQNRNLWSLEDQDGELTARSSRALEVFLVEAIDKTFPKSGKVSLLEVGCGSAIYIRHATTKNPLLHALGIELQNHVADFARSNIAKWGLADRVKIEVDDISKRQPDPEFDIVTLFNNIYYFPVENRVELLIHLKKFIKPKGFLLLATCCQGGNLGIEVLNLWGASTTSCGRLPTLEEMLAQLTEAGYKNIETISLIPGDSFYAFRAYN